MTRHSKNCTAGAFFTSAEREKLVQYGTQRERLGRDSLRSPVACVLCLREPAYDPVACSSGGHVFCRECLLTHLLACKRAQQRTLAEEEKLKAATERARAEEEEARQQERIEAFTALNKPGGVKKMRMLEPAPPSEHESGPGGGGGKDQPGSTTRTAMTSGSSRMIGRPSTSSSTLAFWLPEGTPAADQKVLTAMTPSSSSLSPSGGVTKMAIYCPAAGEKDHTISMKQVIPIKWTLSPGETGAAICSVCTNGLRLMTASLTLVKPCGHVFCGKCINNIVGSEDGAGAGPAAASGATETPAKVRASPNKLGLCPECSHPVTGTLLLAGEGSGFAGGGRAPSRLEVKKYDPAFI